MKKINYKAINIDDCRKKYNNKSYFLMHDIARMMDVNIATISRYMSQGRFDGMYEKLGNAYIFHKEDIFDFFKSQR